MATLPVLLWTLLCLVDAHPARNIFEPEEAQEAPEGYIFEPEEAPKAPEGACSSCDRRFLRHYEASGCVAEVLDPCGCPTKFSCTPTNASLEVCLYRGEEFAPGSRIRTGDPCQVCRCQGGPPPLVSCVTRECPPAEGRNCHAEDRCCPLPSHCFGNEIEDDVQAAASKTCVEGERVYPLGAKIPSADDPCMVCECDEGWDAGNRTCLELDCVMERHRGKLDEGCVPVYHEGRCCPIEFYCPASANASLSELATPGETNTTHEDGCFFGGRWYERGQEVGSESACVRCSCAVPPLPTCVHRTCPPAPPCAPVYRPGQCCPDYECMLGDRPATGGDEEEKCPTPMCAHAECRVAVPPGEKCPTCVCGEMVSELEHNNLEQQVQQQVGVGEMEPPSQFLGEADDSSEGGLRLMPLVMERSVGNAPFEESDKEVNEDDSDSGQGLPELDGEGWKRNGTLIINEIWTIDHDVKVPEGCPTPMCEGRWCKILIPEGHNCPTCVCKKRPDADNEP